MPLDRPVHSKDLERFPRSRHQRVLVTSSLRMHMFHALCHNIAFYCLVAYVPTIGILLLGFSPVPVSPVRFLHLDHCAVSFPHGVRASLSRILLFWCLHVTISSSLASTLVPTWLRPLCMPNDLELTSALQPSIGCCPCNLCHLGSVLAHPRASLVQFPLQYISIV